MQPDKPVKQLVASGGYCPVWVVMSQPTRQVLCVPVFISVLCVPVFISTFSLRFILTLVGVWLNVSESVCVLFLI